MTLAVRARGLHRFYRRGKVEVAALLDVTLDVACGETVAIVGPSGSGKSTLLALLAGLDDPDGGSVDVAGERMSHATPGQQARIRARCVGILTQGPGLVDHLDVLANLRLARSLRGRGRGGPSNEELLEAVGLADRMHARPSTLSGGEVARAGLAVALAGGPTILLADEPTAEVSHAEERTVLATMRDLRGAEMAVVVVTHSAEVAAAADRVVALRDGRVL